MAELVAHHTERVAPEPARAYLRALVSALRAARLSKAFPDRPTLTRYFELMATGLAEGQYPGLLLDARTGLPNMASFTRVATDAEVAAEYGVGVGEEAKQRYRRALLARPLAPIERHEVALRRHDADAKTSAVRLELTKLDASGSLIRVRVELTQRGASRRGVSTSGEDFTARAGERLHAQVYRHAAFDAETLFLQLDGLADVEVERVERGVIGPLCVRFADGGHAPSQLEGALGPAFARWREHAATSASGPLELMACFASDFAARDLPEERSNDPLLPLLRDRIGEGERARYEARRAAAPFRVFKDRKFVVTRGLRELAEALCEAAGTRNLIYELR